MQIAFIGLGAMGAPIATNLLASGHQVCVYNRTPERTRPLRLAGASVAPSPAAAARQAHLVISMVADDAGAEEVAIGKLGVVAGARPGTVHVSMSTISVGLARKLETLHRHAGLGFVSATVFGRPEAAAQRKLFVMAAGQDLDVKLVRPVLAQVAESVSIVGTDCSQANLVKLIGNFMLMSLVETLGEACAVAGKGDVRPELLVELLTTTVFTAPAYRIYGPAIAAQRFQPAGFTLPLGQKDNRLLLAAADALGVPMPIASLVHDRFLAARARGFGAGHDLAALAAPALGDAGA